MTNQALSANAGKMTEVVALEKTKLLFQDIFGESPRLDAHRYHANAVIDVYDRRFLIEFKPSATTTAVSTAISALKRAEQSRKERVLPLVVVPHMSESSRTRCRAAGVSWMDLSGNAEIKDDNLFVLIEGRPNQFKTRGRPRNPFAPKSSRIVRTLLDDPAQSYFQKDLVEITGVSKALVSQVVSHLEDLGLISRREDGSIEVVDPGILIDEWRDSYSITDHQITRGHIYSSGQSTELVWTLGKMLNEIGVSYAFTGLSSAWHYAPFSTFRLVAVYVDDPLSIVNSTQVAFSPEPRGANVWVIQPNDEGVFWKSVIHQNVRFASPIQTYLDLKDHPERADEAGTEMRSFVSQTW